MSSHKKGMGLDRGQHTVSTSERMFWKIFFEEVSFKLRPKE